MKRINFFLLFSVFVLHALFLYLLSFMGTPLLPPKPATKIEIVMMEEKPLTVNEMERDRIEAILEAPPAPSPPPAIVEPPPPADEPAGAAEEAVEEAPVVQKEEKAAPPTFEVKEKPKEQEVKKEKKAPPKPIVKAEKKKSPQKQKPVQNKPKVVAKKTVKTAPVKKPSSELTTAQPGPSKEERERSERLLSMMKSSINSLDVCATKSGSGVAGGKSSKGSSSAQTLGKLKSESLSIQVGGSSSFANELCIYLKHKLTLPEPGQVKLKLTLTREGHVKDLAILSATSEKNRSYIERTIKALLFPALPSSEQDSFLLTLKGD